MTDSYVLANRGQSEQTIRVLYPFASNLNGLDKNRPILTMGEKELDTKLYVGTYTGGFQGAWENWKETHENPGSLNLQGIESWEGFQVLLSDGTYLKRTLDGFVDLSHIPATVYEFTDAWGPEENEEAGIPNPSIREEGERGYGTPNYLIVIGEDIQNLQYQGYVTGGWDTKKTVEAGVTATRTETNLEEALRQAVKYNYQDVVDVGNYFESNPEYGFELVTALGSNLYFTQQTALLEDRGQIEIVRQNFGFNPANGINEVVLDMTKPHCYLEVRGLERDK